MRIKVLLLVSFLLVGGCARYFEEPMQPDTCWLCFDGEWTLEDIHLHTNRIVRDKYYQPKRPELNGYCLETAELKYEMAHELGYAPEIVVIRLHKDVENFRGASSPLHAVLVVDGTVYDNGFINETPFDRESLNRYGIEVPDVWSDYRKVK